MSLFHLLTWTGLVVDSFFPVLNGEDLRHSSAIEVEVQRFQADNAFRAPG